MYAKKSNDQAILALYICGFSSTDSSEKLRGDCKLGGMKSENKYKHKTWL